MNRAFLRFAAAHGASRFGDFLSAAAMSQLVFQRLGGADLGVLQGAGMLVGVTFGPLLGVAADHRPAKQTMVRASLVMALLTAGFLLFDFHAYIVLLVLKSIVGSLFDCSDDRFFPSLVGDAELARASGYLSTTSQIASTIGSAAGSYLLIALGPKVFLIDAVTFLVSAALLVSIRTEVPAASRGESRTGARGVALKLKEDLAAGLAHLLGDRTLLAIVVFVALGHICWGIQSVASWAIVLHHLQVPDRWAGTYQSMAALGGLAVAVALAMGIFDVTSKRSPSWAAGALIVLALTFVATGLSSNVVIGFALRAVGGVVSILMSVIARNMLILRAPEAIRGRIAGLVNMTNSMVMLGARLAGGFLIDVVPARVVYLATGGGVVVAAVGVVLYGVVRERLSAPLSRARPPLAG